MNDGEVIAQFNRRKDDLKISTSGFSQARKATIQTIIVDMKTKLSQYEKEKNWIEEVLPEVKNKNLTKEINNYAKIMGHLEVYTMSMIANLERTITELDRLTPETESLRANPANVYN